MSFSERLRLLFGICPNKKMKKLISKGLEAVIKEFNIIKVLHNIRLMKQTLKQEGKLTKKQK